MVSSESGTVIVLVTYQPSAAATSKVSSQAAGTTDEKAMAHLLGLFVHSRPLLKYSFLHALHQRRTEIDQILDLSRQSELNSRPIARVRQFDLTVNLRGQSCLESLQGA